MDTEIIIFFQKFISLALKSEYTILNAFSCKWFVGSLAALRPTMSHLQGGSLTQSICACLIWREGHRKPRSEARSQIPAVRISGIQSGNLSIKSECAIQSYCATFLKDTLKAFDDFKNKQ